MNSKLDQQSLPLDRKELHSTEIREEIYSKTPWVVSKGMIFCGLISLTIIFIVGLIPVDKTMNLTLDLKRTERSVIGTVKIPETEARGLKLGQQVLPTELKHNMVRISGMITDIYSNSAEKPITIIIIDFNRNFKIPVDEMDVKVICEKDYLLADLVKAIRSLIQ